MKKFLLWATMPLLVVALCACGEEDPIDDKGVTDSTENNGGTTTGDSGEDSDAVSSSPLDIFTSLSYDDMVYVEGGTFLMGAQATDPNAPNYDSDADEGESPVHSVTLSSYYISKYEVTEQLLEYVMHYTGKAADGSTMTAATIGSWAEEYDYTEGNYHPADVSYSGIVDYFIPRLNKITGKTFRLPTEAEWEYAARGGNQSKGYKYSGSNIIDDVAWYSKNSGNKTHPVGVKQPNELGIYDMSGNAYEWCSDWVGNYSSASQTDPKGPSFGVYDYRVRRGGSEIYLARGCRVSMRGAAGIANQHGFRLVCPK